MPSRSALPGRRLCMTTSDEATSRATTSRPASGAQVDGQVALAPVAGLEEVGHGPHLVAAERLDLDHVGAEVGQELGAVGRGEEAAEVEDPHAVERVGERGAARAGPRRRTAKRGQQLVEALVVGADRRGRGRPRRGGVAAA